MLPSLMPFLSRDWYQCQILPENCIGSWNMIWWSPFGIVLGVGLPILNFGLFLGINWPAPLYQKCEKWPVFSWHHSFNVQFWLIEYLPKFIDQYHSFRNWGDGQSYCIESSIKSIGWPDTFWNEEIGQSWVYMAFFESINWYHSFWTGSNGKAYKFVAFFESIELCKSLWFGKNVHVCLIVSLIE